MSFVHDPERNFAPSRLADARFNIAIITGSGGGGSGDIMAPNASVDSATYTTRGSGANIKYDVSVDWSATDDTDLNGGSVNEVRLYNDTGSRVDTKGINPTGTSDSGTVQFKDVRSMPSDWTAEVVVSDAADNRDSDTATGTAT